MPEKILALGEVLWDLLPSGKQLGGAPANFTFQCRSLGADARLVTRVGDDDLGREVLDRLRSMGLPTDTVQIDPARPTGTVDVPWPPTASPATRIRADVAWDRIEADAPGDEPRRLGRRRLLRQPRAERRAVAALDPLAGRRRLRPGALRMFDVNLRPPFVDRGVIDDSLVLANALKLNDQELPALAAMFGLPAETRGGDGRPGRTGSASRWWR